MARARSLSHVIYLILTTVAVAGLKHPEGLVAMFVFGDSLYDPGNNNYINTTADFRANFPPYGKSYFSIPTGRFSDGRIIPDFISEYANLPLIPPYLKPGVRNYKYGVNFASGGAGALVESYQGFVVDLKTQLRYFKKVEKKLRHKLGAERSKVLISSAVYLISIGGNDYISPFTFNPSFYGKYSKQEYIGMVLGNMTHFIEGMYKMGARKFGLVTMPPLGCIPGIKLLEPRKNGACFEEATILAKMHNKQLPKRLKLIQTRFSGFNYTIQDLYPWMTKILETPSKYGFKVSNMGCCGSGPFRGIFSCGGKRGVKEFELCEDVEDFFFFDASHATQKAYKQLSELLWNGDSDITEPYSLKAFFQY